MSLQDCEPSVNIWIVFFQLSVMSGRKNLTCDFFCFLTCKAQRPFEMEGEAIQGRERGQGLTYFRGLLELQGLVLNAVQPYSGGYGG